VLVASLWLGGAPDVLASGEHKVPDLRGEGTTKSRRTAAKIRIPLTVHVAVVDGRLAMRPHRLNRSVDRTNQALAGVGIEVYIARIVLMPEGFGGIKYRRDRRKLAEFAPADGTVHLFLVDTVELGSMLRVDRSVRGLHWRYRGLRRKLRNREYLAIGSDAPATTMVHELGHLFGLEHSDGQQNLMCSCREGPRQIFTRSQSQQIRSGALAFLRRSGGQT
jgi:hypothetical protein